MQKKIYKVNIFCSKKRKEKKKIQPGEYSAQSPGNVWKLPWGDTYYHG
jgi:hypothetical protein